MAPAIRSPWWAGAALALAFSANAEPPQSDLPLDKLLNTEISTASKYEQTVSQAPASVTIISAEEIRRYGWETLADVMQMVRGFYTSYDRNYHYVGVRGFSRETDYNNRLLLLINGHPINETVFGSAPFGTDLALDLDMLERIEIVRGPGSSLYGTGAMFAVVNLITRSGAMLDGVSASASAGSLGKKRGALYGGSGSLAGADIAASAVINRTSGRDLRYPQYPNAVAHDLDFDDSHNLLATIRIGGLSILGNTMKRDKGMPTGSFGVDFANRESHTTDERSFGALRYDKQLGPKKKMMLRAFAHQYHYDGVYPYSGVRWLDRGDGRWMGAEAQMRIDLRANHRITGGMEYADHREASYHYGQENGYKISYNIPHSVVSLYAEDEYQPLTNLSLTGGFRYDDYSHLQRTVISPHAAVIWEPRRSTTLKLIYGRSYRAPSTYELAYIDPVGGVQGNPALGAEKIDTWEAIVEHRLGDNLYGIVDVFENRIRDLVDPRGESGVLRFENIGAVRARGIEAEIQGRFERLWTYASVALQNAEESAVDQHLTNSPRRLARFGVSSPAGQRAHVAFEAMYESARTTLRATKTDPIYLANGRIAFALRNRLELSLVARNLFDTHYATPAGYEHRQDAIAQDGRTFAIKLHYGI